MALTTQTAYAKQDINNMYAKMVGAISQKQVIDFLIYLSHFMAVLSVVASAYGFYYDAYDLIGDATYTIIFAITIATVLELLRYYLIKGVFAFENIIVKAVMLFAIVFLTMSLMNLHTRGMQNMKLKTDSNVLKEVVSSNAELQKLAQENISRTLDISTETAKQFNNGTSWDDAKASTTIASNASLAKALLSSTQTTYAQKELIKAEEKRSEARKNVLTPLFRGLEMLVPLSFASLFLVWLVTSRGTKETRNIMDEIAQTEANINSNIQALLLQNAKNSTDDIMAIVKYFNDNQGAGMDRELFIQLLDKNGINYSQQTPNTPPTPTSVQPIKQQLEGQYSPNTRGSDSKKQQKETDDKMNSFGSTFSDTERTETVVEEECEEIETEELVELPKAIDSKLFSPDEEKLIQAMWANGTRRVGHTYTKREIENYFTDSEMYSPAEIKTLMYLYTPLNVKLTGQGFVKLINGFGYEVLVELSSVHKV
jgi:hypothetical protein